MQLYINININNILMYLYIIYTTYYKYLSKNSVFKKAGDYVGWAYHIVKYIPPI